MSLMTQFFVGEARLWKFMKIAPCDSSLVVRQRVYEGLRIMRCALPQSFPSSPKVWSTAERYYCMQPNPHLDVQHWRKPFLIEHCVSLRVYWYLQKYEATREVWWTEVTLPPRPLCKSEIFDISCLQRNPSLISMLCSPEGVALLGGSLDKQEKYFLFKHFPCSVNKSLLCL